jgi:hypothetical protein
MSFAADRDMVGLKFCQDLDLIIMSVTQIIVIAPKMQIAITFSIFIGFQRFENGSKAINLSFPTVLE